MNQRIDISIVIPAFNEAERLPQFLERIISFCLASQNTYEIIVVDDGSIDATFQKAASYKSRFPNLSVLRIGKNRGKGHAVKKGLFESQGEICLFLDADGSVEPEEIERNSHYLKEGYDIFIGSRALHGQGQTLKVKWYRKAIGVVFNFFVHTFLFKQIKDTQCGFKIFKKDIIVPLLSRTYLDGFGFDIEVLYLAHRMGYKIKEGPVSWRHVNAGKINLIKDSIKMFWNILQARNWHCTPINLSAQYMGPDEYRFMHELEDYHWWFTSRRNLVKQLILSLKGEFSSILDVGSGTGGNLVMLKEFADAYGIDASRQAVEFCKKRGLDKVKQCRAERIEFNDGTFDMVTCLDVLEHIPQPVVALREIKRVLKDSGKMIVAVPAFRILWSQHDEALSHLRRYEKRSLMAELKEGGFKVEKIGYFFFLSFFIVAPVRIARRFLNPGKRKIQSDTTTLPPKFLNEFLKLIFSLETKIALHVGLPLGTTLYAVAEKANYSASQN